MDWRTGYALRLRPLYGLQHTLIVHSTDVPMAPDTLCFPSPDTLWFYAQFLTFVHELAELGRRSRATPASLTGAVLQAWFHHSFPKLGSTTLAAAHRQRSNCGVKFQVMRARKRGRRGRPSVAADADLSHAPTMRWPTWNGPRSISHVGRSSLAMGQRWTGMWVIAALASTCGP